MVFQRHRQTKDGVYKRPAVKLAPELPNNEDVFTTKKGPAILKLSSHSLHGLCRRGNILSKKTEGKNPLY